MISFSLPPPLPSLPEQLYPQVFDGAKIIIQKGLSRYFQTSHTITLGSDVQPSQWQFGATYVGSKVVGENEVINMHTIQLLIW